jgi:hypothetical protein
MERICPGQLEMNVFNKKVCGDQPCLFTYSDDRHVISDTFQQGRIRGGGPSSDPVDKPKLTDFPEIHHNGS